MSGHEEVENLVTLLELFWLCLGGNELRENLTRTTMPKTTVRTYGQVS
jgi:hypothetical protein